MMMIDAAGAFGALLYGTVLLWAAVNITSHLTRVVRVPRPAPFVFFHMTTVWTVGSVSVLMGLTMILQGLTLLGHVSQ